MSRFTLITPTTDGSRLYKVFKKDPQGVVSRDKENPGTFFQAEYKQFNNFAEMCDALTEIEEHGNLAILRGDISAEMEARVIAGAKVRRIKFQRKNEPPGFQPAVRDWVMLDVDKLEVPVEEWDAVDPATHPNEAIDYVASKLPYYFKNVSCWWQFSASQNVFAGYRTISVHMFYMIDRTVSDRTLRSWAESQLHVPGHLPIDPGVYDCIQPHYIATPRFVGLDDPLSKRSGVYERDQSIVVFDVPAEEDGDVPDRGNIHPLINMKKLKPYLDQIGDDVGKLGFSDAIKSVVGKYFSLHGSVASDIPLKGAIRKAIEDAPKRHGRPMDGVGSPGHYAADEWLDPLIRSIRNKEQVEKESQQNIYKDCLERYVWVEEVERFLDMSTLTTRTKSGVTDTHAHEIQKLADNLLNDGNLRRVSRQTYKPGAPTFCEDYDPRTGRVFRAYNVYTPSDLVPQNPKDSGWFVDHLHYLCDGEDAAFAAIVNWCAHLVQFPDEKLNYGIMLQGRQGTGKSFLSQIMSRILGQQNCTSSVTTQQLMSQFTDWMMGKHLVTIEEIRDQEDRYKVYNHMKGLITNDTVKINTKGLPAYDIPNRTNFICYTNYEDAVPMDDDDRRFIIHFSKAKPKPAEYYQTLAQHMEINSGAVLTYLREVNLKMFNPKGRAPMTKSKSAFLANSGSPLARWLREGIEGDMFPFNTDLLTGRDLRAVLPPVYRNISELALIAALNRMEIVTIGRHRLPHGRQDVYCFRNAEKWQKATEEQIVAYYQVPSMDGGMPHYMKPIKPRMAGASDDY